MHYIVVSGMERGGNDISIINYCLIYRYVRCRRSNELISRADADLNSFVLDINHLIYQEIK